MGRRRTHMNRGKKREDGAVCKDTWRRHEDNAALKTNIGATANYLGWDFYECANKESAEASVTSSNTHWGSENLTEYYGKVDVPAVTLWDDLGVREAWDSAEQRKTLHQDCSNFSPDLYNDTHIDWDHRTVCSLPDSAEEADDSAEREWAQGIYEMIHKDSNNVIRPPSPRILGLIELHKEKGYEGWECPPDAQIVATGWVMPSETGGEVPGWDNGVPPLDQWASGQPHMEQAGTSAWEPPHHTQQEQPSWPSLENHADWCSPAIQSAGHTNSIHPVEEVGARVEGSNMATTAGCSNGLVSPEIFTVSTVNPAIQSGKQAVTSGWGWDDYPCYTNQAAREGGSWWPEEPLFNEDYHDSSNGHHRSSHVEHREPVHVKWQDHTRTRHFASGRGKGGHTGRHWHGKQAWSAASLTQATKLC